MTRMVDLHELASEQHGLVTLTQARALGINSDHARGLASTEGWSQLTDEVLRRTGTAPTNTQRLLAAVLDAGTNAVLSHLTAARLWGLSGCSDRPVHVTRLIRGSRSTDLAVVHTVRSLPDRWVTRLDGIPIVRPELLSLQLFAVCHEDRAERLVDALWSMRLLSGTSLIRFLAQLGRRGRNGTAGLRRFVDARGPLYTPPASGLEHRARQILADAGFEFRLQVDSGGEQWTGRVDLRDIELPLIVEIQSERHHAALVDQLADALRIAQLEADGFVVVQVTDTEVWTRPWVVVQRVIAGRRLAAARSVPRNRGNSPRSGEQNGK